MAYASMVDATGRPMEVSTEKKASTTTPVIAQPAIQPPATNSWGSMSFGSTAPSAAAAAVAPAVPVVNKLCEFEVIGYNQSSIYKQKPYVRPSHVGYRQWLQVLFIK